MIPGGAGDGVKGIVIAEKIVPRQITFAQSDSRLIINRKHDGERRIGLTDFFVERQLLAAAQDKIIGEDRFRLGDTQAGGDFIRGEAVGDGNRHAPGADDAQINRHRLDRHEHVDGDGIAGLQTRLHQPVGHATGQGVKFRVAHGVERAVFAGVDDRRGVRVGIEATVGDVQHRPGQPVGGAHISIVSDDPIWLGHEVNAQPVDQLRPEPGDILHRPAMQRFVIINLLVAHQGGEIRGINLVPIGAPDRGGASCHIPIGK